MSCHLNLSIAPCGQIDMTWNGQMPDGGKQCP